MQKADLFLKIYLLLQKSANDNAGKFVNMIFVSICIHALKLIHESDDEIFSKFLQLSRGVECQDFLKRMLSTSSLQFSLEICVFL